MVIQPSGPLRIGLTGGIGSGKSTAGRLLAEGQGVSIDVDALSHRLTSAGGAAMPQLTQAFGIDVAATDGSLDRARMRTLVFSDPTARQRLEAILHPLIGQLADAQAAAAVAAGAAFVVFDVPLLVESGRWRARVDRVLVVDCDEATQVRRVVSRSGWTEAEVRRVMAQQASRAARRAVADAVVFNDEDDLASLRDDLQALRRAWRMPAGARG